MEEHRKIHRNVSTQMWLLLPLRQIERCENFTLERDIQMSGKIEIVFMFLSIFFPPIFIHIQMLGFVENKSFLRRSMCCGDRGRWYVMKIVSQKFDLGRMKVSVECQLGTDRGWDVTKDEFVTESSWNLLNSKISLNTLKRHASFMRYKTSSQFPY